MPKVSIILPTYKRPKFLKRAVESVLAQDYKDWELVIINDGSKDEEPLILEYADKDSRIKYGFLHKNSGCVSIPRNIGIIHSSGEYICPLDDDIVMMPNRLGLSQCLLDVNPNLMLIYGAQLRQNQKTKEFEVSNIPNYNPMNGWGVDNNQIMYRRSVYDKVTMKFPRRACDWELMKDIWTEYPNSFHHIPDVLSKYEWHGGNRSLDNSTKTKEIHPEDFQDTIWWHRTIRHYNIDWTAK